MSKYTTQVRFICETAAGQQKSQGFNSIDEILTVAAPVVFNFDFPIFDEKYRLPLEKKILMHYYTREIGEETVGLWKLRLNSRMCEIMPYYNKLYESELIEFDPMRDVDLTTSHERQSDGTQNTAGEETRNVTDNTTAESSGTSETEGSQNDTNRDLYSDTPQGAITNLENGTYLTNARKETNERNSNDNSSFTSNSSTDTTTDTTASSTGSTISKNTEEYIQEIFGKRGGASYSKLLSEFRETFLNIDSMIINELSDLFFGLWE